MKKELIYGICDVADKIQRKSRIANVSLRSSIVIPLTTLSVIKVESNGYFCMAEKDNINGTESDWLPLAILDTYILNNILTMLESMSVEG